MAGAYGKIFEAVPDEKKGIAKKLIQELNFMDRTIKKLKESVESSGGIEHFKNGKQEFMREDPALKSYNMTVKTRTTVYSQLLSLLPKAEAIKSESDGFEDFVFGRE